MTAPAHPPPRRGPSPGSLEAATTTAPRAAGRLDWRAHVTIARPDHWIKNVFVIPGMVIAAESVPALDWAGVAGRSLIGLVAICLVTSSNYTLNEVLDAPYDRFHPFKATRPVPAGRVRPAAGYVQWLVLFAVGVMLALQISWLFTVSLIGLWVMACAYNVPPVRAKDQPGVDVLTEAVNNPLRMLAGWFIVTSETFAPASLLFSYWMVGCYFMALKRYAELPTWSRLGDAVAYRPSFAWYTRERLIVQIVFYAAASMLFFGAFCMRYRLELILAFPLVALVMALYLRVALKPESAAQHPERLWREKALISAAIGASIVMVVLLRVDLPVVHRLLTPTAPAQYGPEPAPP